MHGSFNYPLKTQTIRKIQVWTLTHLFQFLAQFIFGRFYPTTEASPSEYSLPGPPTKDLVFQSG